MAGLRRQSKFHAPDLIFLSCFVFVAVFGLVMLSSASSAIAFQRFGNNLYYISHQLTRGFLPGVLFCAVAALIDYHVLRRFAFTLFAISIGLLVAVLIPGIGVSFGGAQSWIDLGPIVFQPAEITKLAFIMYLAVWLEKRDKKVIKDFSDGLMPFLLSLIIVMGLMVAQPDVGTMTVIAMIAMMVYFAAGASIKHLIGLGMIGAGLLFALIKVAPYRTARLTVFLHPELDPQGIGYHINQALLAIGSGGLFGLGFAHSRQKHLYLPEVIGDSIFAVISEELGFMFVCVFLAILFTLMYRGYQIARNAPDNFGRFMAVGVISWVGFQSFINISAMVGLLPITGLPLPFVSYGSSSLIVLFIAMGIVINISRQTVATSKQSVRRFIRQEPRASSKLS